MTELIRLMPANEEDYPNYAAIELRLQDGSYHIDAISVEGETEETAECFNLTASLAYMACVLARNPGVEYIVDT